MASCGIPMPARFSRLNEGRLPVLRFRHWLRFLAAALTTLALGGFLGGCATMVEYGTLPPTDKLKQLTPGVSTGNDVIRALGEPRGKGMVHLAVPTGRDVAHLSALSGKRTLWLYEYTRAEGNQMHLKILLVFMDGDVYDGHLWFSSVGIMFEEEK